MVFKTSSPPLSGTKPEKGGECEIVSTISHHRKMLKDIANTMDRLGYERLILRDEVLDEKVRRKADVSGATGHAVSHRKFENTIRACALKNLILRWLDNMERHKETGLRFFYRPIAALKSGHKGSTVTASATVKHVTAARQSKA